ALIGNANYSVDPPSSRPNQLPPSRRINCDSSPESSQIPPHFSQVSMATSSNWVSFKAPSHRGHRIDEVPAALASSETFILSRNFSTASWFLRWKYSSSKPFLRSSRPSPIRFSFSLNQ